MFKFQLQVLVPCSLIIKTTKRFLEGPVKLNSVCKDVLQSQDGFLQCSTPLMFISFSFSPWLGYNFVDYARGKHTEQWFTLHVFIRYKRLYCYNLWIVTKEVIVWILQKNVIELTLSKSVYNGPTRKNA